MAGILKIIFNVIKIICSAVILLITAFLAWWLVIIPMGNNMILHKYVRELEQLDVGCDYEIIEQISACGKLYGNGNGMQYMAMVLIKSEEELEETSPVESWEGVWIIRADNKEWLDGNLDVPGAYRTDKMVKALEELENPDEYYVFYLVYSAEFDSFWNMDIRAH